MAKKSKWKKYPKGSPLTIERLEQALDMLSEIILDYGDRGHELLPIYKKLAAERESMIEKETLMNEVRQRAESLRNR